MKKNLLRGVLIAAIGLSNNTFADILTLKDGQSLSGTLISRDSNGVVFDIAGQQLTFSSDKVANISFGEITAGNASNTQASENTDSAQSLSVPAGTKIMARTNVNVNSKQHKVGHKFTARLEADLVVNSQVVAPRGATIYGVINNAKQSGRLVGKSSIELTFTDIMIKNQLHPITTTNLTAVTDGTAKNTLGTTARTAAIGGLMNGSKGAKDGAKIGAGVSILTRGNTVNMPSGTLLEFQLSAPLTVK